LISIYVLLQEKYERYLIKMILEAPSVVNKFLFERM